MNIEGSFTQTGEKSKLINLSFDVNGQQYVLKVPATYRLVDILRKELQLTGTKISCEIGRCGSCSVLMNGQLVNSCLIMAYQLQESEIETIENLSKNELHPIQQAFLEEGALQCGYCTPGMVMALKSLLTNQPKPNLEEVSNALSGNICRCTGYNGIIRAVHRYIENS
ncbi:(2Fe-2S)-binding protein [Bacillus sp. PS06]|uniref:(2Fe-2S)-binding protein n=1 Tax=Bacillus sp. PS06 TaxID=2764176 RepID=UPI001784A1E2|nr:(2Fe-2S)-binding protein [Bacillus sp. PS06]MBD8068002.1 (2Fe-2S)-binding protein [Bacillus sp. PS06]